jgi:hypothetical protein
MLRPEPRTRHTPDAAAFRFASGALLIYLGVFALLSADVLVRIFLMRDRLPNASDAAILMALELARLLTTGLIIVLAAIAARRSRRAATRTFTFLLIFLGVWYTKAFAFENFPGHLQEWIALRLFGWGVPLAATQFIFGSPVWALWLALGALLRMSVTWPRPLDARRIAESGGRDRTGLLRSVSLAGADVGAAFRNAAVRLLEGGWLRARFVWPIVAVAGTLSTFIGSGRVDAQSVIMTTARTLLIALFFTGFALAVTNLRAAYQVARRRQRWSVMWLMQGALTAAAAFLVSGLLSLRADAATATLSFAVVTLAPLGVLMAFASATQVRVPDPRLANCKTIALGTGAVVGTVAYLVLQFALAPLAAQPAPVREIIAIGASVLIVAALRDRFRLIAERITAAPAASPQA